METHQRKLDLEHSLSIITQTDNTYSYIFCPGMYFQSNQIPAMSNIQRASSFAVLNATIKVILLYIGGLINNLFINYT